VILSDKSTLALAADYGISHQAISQIRLGHVYAEVHAHLEKQGHRLPSHGKKLCVTTASTGAGTAAALAFLMPATTLLRIVTYTVPPRGTNLLQ
jgi:transcriptional regulatory protein LevR